MTSTTPSTKILVCGDVEGQWDALFSRIEILHNGKSGPFDLLFCCGIFFSAEDSLDMIQKSDFLSQTKKIPIATYFFGHEPQSFDFRSVNNLHYIGDKSGKLSIGELRVAFFRAKAFDPEALSDPKSCLSNFVNEESESISWTETDFLLSDLIPRCILAGQPEIEQQLIAEQNTPIEQLRVVEEISKLYKPRYHLASRSSIYFERSPFLFEDTRKQESARLMVSHSSISRFLTIPAVTNINKQKWLYAVNVIPRSILQDTLLVEIPSNVTPNPFFADERRVIDRKDQQRERQPLQVEDCNQKRAKTALQFDPDVGILPLPEAYRNPDRSRGDRNEKDHRVEQRDQNRDRSSRGRGRNRGQVRDRPLRQPAKRSGGDCWFCLNSPSVEDHLIIAVANDAYLALPKGGLADEHCLIIPIDHVTHPSQFSPSLSKEIVLLKQALKACFLSIGKEAVFFERNVPTRHGETHCHIQAVPVPPQVGNKLRAEFDQQSKENGFDLVELGKGSSAIEATQSRPFFCVELPDGTQLLKVVAPEENHPLQFGRVVLANALGEPRKINWQYNVLSKEEEEAAVAKFKTLFQPFDFSQKIQ